MNRYGKWKDDFIEVIRVQNDDRENTANNLRMVALTQQAESFKPEPDKFMKDEPFALIYSASIERMSGEI